MSKRLIPAPQEIIHIKRENKKFIVIDNRGHIYLETKDFDKAKECLVNNEKYKNFESPDRFQKLNEQELDDWFRTT